MTVHEHVQQALSAMLDGQDDPDLDVLAGAPASSPIVLVMMGG